MLLVGVIELLSYPHRSCTKASVLTKALVEATRIDCVSTVDIVVSFIDWDKEKAWAP